MVTTRTRTDSPQANDARESDFNRLDGISVVIAGLMTAASVGGLWLHDLYRDNTWSKAAFRGSDLATLLFAAPALLIALALARRGWVWARLAWFGVLGYNVYGYAFYLFGTAFNDFFLLYAALLALSLITLLLAAPRLTGIARLSTSAPTRLVGGYMTLVGVMFGAVWTANAARFIVTDELPKVVVDSGIHTNIVFALDLVLIVPALVIGGAQLWRREPWGIVSGVALNTLCVLYMISLAFAGAFQANAGIDGASWSAPPYVEIGVASAVALWLVARCTTSALDPTYPG